MTAAGLGKWNDAEMEAADLITSTISGSIERKLPANALNDGYIMITRLAGIYGPQGDADFMRLTQEYYYDNPLYDLRSHPNQDSKSVFAIRV